MHNGLHYMKTILTTMALAASMLCAFERPELAGSLTYEIHTGGIDNTLPDFSQPLTSMQFIDKEETIMYNDFLGVYTAPYQNNSITESQLERFADKAAAPFKTNWSVSGGFTHPWLSMVVYRESRVLDEGSIVSSMLFDNGNPSHSASNLNGLVNLENVQVGGIAFRELRYSDWLTLYLELGMAELTQTGGIEWYPDTEESASQKSIHGYVSSSFLGHTAQVRGYSFFIKPDGVGYPGLKKYTTDAEVVNIPSITINSTRDIWGAEIEFGKEIDKTLPLEHHQLWYGATYGYTIERETWSAASDDAEQATLDSAFALERSSNTYFTVSGVHSSGIGIGFSRADYDYLVSNEETRESEKFTSRYYQINLQWYLDRVLNFPESDFVQVEELLIETYYGDKYSLDESHDLYRYLQMFDYTTFETSISTEILLPTIDLTVSLGLAYGSNNFRLVSADEDYWKFRVGCYL